MGHIILQPMANKDAHENYTSTIGNPVDVETIIKFVDKKTEEKIRSLYLDNQAYVWGVKNGKKNVNFNKWCKVTPGDFVLFAAKKEFFSMGVATLTLKNPKLAKALWGVDQDGEAWENIYLIDEIKNIQLSYEEFNQWVDYAPGKNVQGFHVMDERRSECVINRLQLYSDYYSNDISDGEYEKEIKHLMNSNLDTITNGTSRKEQSYLRKKIFKDKKLETCSICGAELPVDLLVTAHLKRRADCTKDERLDVENIVLPMCKMGCDDLYEKGYILVEQGVIKVNENKYKTPWLERYLDRIDGTKCTGWKKEMAKYFEYHNTRAQ